MKITGQQLDAIRVRVADGTADDDDRRLAALYADTDVTSDPEPAGQTGEKGQTIGLVGRADAEVIKGSPAPKKSTRRSNR